MAIIGTLCPPGYKDNDKKIKRLGFDTCITNCKNKCLPEPVLNVMFDRLKKDHHKGTYISATALQGCMRQTYLERTKDYYIRPSDRHYDSLRGSLIHETLSVQDKNKYIIEKDLYYDFKCDPYEIIEEDGNKVIRDYVRLYGRIDLYDKEKRKIIDFKTQKDNGLDFLLRNGEPKKDHIIQTNIYKFLLEKGKFKDKRFKVNKKVESIEIIYMSMKGAVATGYDYFVKQRGNLNQYHVKEIPLADNEKIEQYIRDRIFILRDAFVFNELPPPPDEETQGWLCGTNRSDGDGYCEVRNICPFWLELAEQKGWKID